MYIGLFSSVYRALLSEHWTLLSHKSCTKHFASSSFCVGVSKALLNVYRALFECIQGSFEYIGGSFELL